MRILLSFKFLPFFYHLPVNSLLFTNLPVNLKGGKSSTLVLLDREVLAKFVHVIIAILETK
jgi:hypothetical protein